MKTQTEKGTALLDQRGHPVINRAYVERIENERKDLLATLKITRDALRSLSNAYQSYFDVMPVAWQTYDHIVDEAKLAAETIINNLTNP